MARQQCAKCTLSLNHQDKGVMQCCVCKKMLHMRCDGINFDEQKAIDMSKDRQDTHIIESCTTCTAKFKLNTGLLFKDDPLISSKSSVHEKELNTLKTQLTSANEELKAAKLNIEIIIQELNEAKSTIPNKEKIIQDKVDQIQNRPSTSSQHKGFTPSDNIQAIQDLVAMQGKSMKWMTESFKKVVDIVSKLDKKLDQRAPTKIINEIVNTPQLSYAEALIRRNNITGRSRNIAITAGENDDELLKQIRNDSAFNELSIENIKRTQKNRLNVTLTTSSEANKFETMFSSKYKDKVSINKLKDIEAKFKIVNVPMETIEQVFRSKIYSCNRWIEADTLIFDREYSSNLKTKNIVYRCSNNTLSLIVKKGMVRIDLEEYLCYDDFPLLQCFKCCAFGHTATSCTQNIACKNCGGDHNHKDCEVSKPSCINCLRAETASGIVHSGKHRATAGICPIRAERMRKVIHTLVRT